jgi:GH24 family phage-related lysozyme (muramidase)
MEEHPMRNITLMGLSCLVAACASTPPVERVEDALTPGIFLEPESRDALPAGVELRAVYAKGLEVTKLSEGFRARLYNDVANYCSIAYGHLVKRGPCDGSETDEFRRGVGEPRAATILTHDMAGAQRTVMVSVKVALSDAKFAALCDFVYNVGPTQFKYSALLGAVNKGQFDQVPLQLRRWIRAGGREVDGLKNRREREIALFFDGEPTPRTVPPEGLDLSPLDIRTGR